MDAIRAFEGRRGAGLSTAAWHKGPGRIADKEVTLHEA